MRRCAVLRGGGDPAGSADWTITPLPHPDGPAGPPVHVDTAGLPELIRRIESEHAPRWVWRSTNEVYPHLLEAGVRVARCHDLSSTRRLLLAHEGRWAELDAAGDDGGPAVEEAQAALFTTDPAPVVGPEALDPAAEDADQGERIRTARRDVRGFALLVAAESACALAALEMGRAGLPWDETAHEQILTDLLGAPPGPGHGRPARLQQLAQELAAHLATPGLNPDSPADLLRALRRAGLPVTSTNRHELARHDHPVVPLVRRYKELARLWTAHGWAWRETWVRRGRFHPQYVPAGVVSGRWATRGGGALQIPKAVRGAVRAPAGRVLVVADAGQLEPRVLAALSADAGMVDATRAGDLYADIAVRALGRAEARAEAKVALLSAMYGGGTGSPALAALARRFPVALALLESAARAGEDGASVRSVLGRVCPPAADGWLDGLDDAAARAHTRSRGRFTRNFVVQASAADWAAVWLAALRRRLAELGPPGARWDPDAAQVVFFQHDEVIVESPRDQADVVLAVVGQAGAEATAMVLGESGVNVPLHAAVVDSYADKP